MGPVGNMISQPVSNLLVMALRTLSARCAPHHNFFFGGKKISPPKRTLKKVNLFDVNNEII